MTFAAMSRGIRPDQNPKRQPLMARKTSKTKTPAPKKTAAPEAAKESGVALKKSDLLDQVVARTNLKKRDVKPAVEAALALMSDALRDGT